MKISFANPGLPGQGVLAVVATRSGGLSPSAQKLDAKMKGGLKRAMAAARFEGKKGQTLSIPAPAGTRLERALLIGLGKAKDLTDLGLQAAGAKIYSELAAAGRAATVCVDALPGAPQEAATIAAQMAYGARLMAYRFDKYRTKLPRDEKPTLAAMAIAVSDAAAARRAYAPLERIADGVCFTRDLVAEPPNVLYPEEMANRLKGLADLGVKVEVLNVAQMKKLGMGALLGVGQGSTRESRVVVMQWNGAADPKAPPVAFIGKGVTFDTGGISIKPSLNMQDMKWDMGGAGAVGGAMMALAGRKAKVNAVGVVGLVENMPDGNAQRPGDVVTSMSGQTIEIQNTDAEGRLVLADVVWYCKDRFKPRFMVDLATLTGAIIITLGHEMAGMFANDDALAQNLEAAGKAVGEPVWRLPLNEEYDKLIKSDIADMKNIGSRGAGSIIGAQFIQRFVDKTPWAHLDIAGMAWTDRNGAVTPKGGTGYGVRLLDRLVADHYEDK